MLNSVSPAVLSVVQSEIKCSKQRICQQGQDCFFDYGVGLAQCDPCSDAGCANIIIAAEPIKPNVQASQVTKVTVTLTNNGQANVRNLRLRVDLPLQTSVVKATVSPPSKPSTPMCKAVPYGNSLFFIIASVAAGETRKFAISYLINDGVSGAQYIRTSLDDKYNYYCNQDGPTVKVSQVAPGRGEKTREASCLDGLMCD